MKVGDLVRLRKSAPGLGIFEGDLAILTKIDWDARDYPAGLGGATGRGFFFFPTRHQTHKAYRREGTLGIMLLYNDFELLGDDHGEDHK